MTTQSEYGFRVEIDAPYAEAIQRVTAALKEEGFGVLTEIDVQATLKKKLDVDFRRYIILGACNPKLAHQAFNHELEVGLLLPCNVIVYETTPGRSLVAIVDPLAMMSVATNAGLRAVAVEAETRLRRVLAAVAA